MSRDDGLGTESFELYKGLPPPRDGTGDSERRPAVEDDVSCEEQFSLWDPDHNVAGCVGWADVDQLHAQIDAVLEGKPLPEGEDRRRRAHQHLASLEGPLASNRIVDVLADLDPPGGSLARPHPLRLAAARLHSEARAFVKQARARIPGNRNSADYQRHRFPGVTLEDLRERAARLAKLLNRFDEVQIQRRAEDIFEIRSG